MSVPEIWGPLWLTIKLASVSTAFLLALCLPLSWWLARAKFKVKPLLEAAIALPIILPPSVIGFYLLINFSPDGVIGKLSEAIGGPRLVFSFTGLVLGSIIYSLPFVAQPLQNAFANVKQEQLDAAQTLGASRLDRFVSIVLAQSKKGILTAVALGFAHTIGEFGLVLMIGGSIPGETRTMSIAIYENVETLNYSNAHSLSAILLVTSFALLVALYSFARPKSLTGK